MAATAVKPIQSEGSIDHEYNKVYTSLYHVYTDSVWDGPRTARTASAGGFAIPARGQSYVWGNDSDPWAWCSSLDAKIISVTETALKWGVTAVHSTKPVTRSSNSEKQNPVDEPAIVHGSYVGYQKAATKDKDGKPIVNVVGEPFIPAPMKDDSRLSIVIEKNTSTISLVQWAEFRDAVNVSSIWGLPPRTVKVMQWDWDVAYYGMSVPYIQHHLEFCVNTDEYDTAVIGRGWDFNILNAGYRYRINCSFPDPWKRVAEIPDGRDNLRHHPTPLDANGNVLDLACGDTERYLNFEVYPEKDFHAISWLPDPLPGPFV